jgi:hypothetical protein
MNVNAVTLFDVGVRQFPQAFWAETVFAGDRHRQAKAFRLAPAVARDIAGECGST